MTKKYTILITGVAGFLGAHLSEKLSNLGHRIIGIDNMTGGMKIIFVRILSFTKLIVVTYPKYKK